MKFLIITLIIYFSNSHLNANEIENTPLGKWPLLVRYDESQCLDVEDDRLNILPYAIAEKNAIHSIFTLSNFGGKVFINPQVNRGWRSITFSVDSAFNRVSESGLSCYQSFDISIKAWPEKYKKLYVVVDKTVRYEILIDKRGLEID
ncbi:hypothetical protein [Aliikangiella coralliicola]|uniref:Uncharacterized protein n=1 Tax=Aliikangiella coralliicola TaxID=2592383 RepID=A0A545U753_9GAMM|nr:hypothetical protein [Aliikangiella coralliicola]TQV85306.1 hypothetical protein FLL46_19255 [Aliikangiella coralliicola]